MKYAELLFANLKERKPAIEANRYLIDLSGRKDFTGKTLKHLISNLKYFLERQWDRRRSIEIDFGEVLFADKLTYLILEIVIYEFISKNPKIKLIINIQSRQEFVLNKGFYYTKLFESIDEKTGELNNIMFLSEYKNFSSGVNFYRKFISSESFKEDIQCPSIISTEIASVLTEVFDDDDWVDAIAEIISELVCNVQSHTDGDCMLHLDIVESVIGLDEMDENKVYKSVSIGILNLAQEQIFDSIKKEFENKNIKSEKANNAYKKVAKAYEIHKTKFTDKYKESDFWFITAFQNHITTRTSNGGTGLTNLIEQIIGKTKAYYSYSLTGNNIIFFKPEYLNVSKERLVGFNKEADYINNIPDEKVIGRSMLYVPGCAYNLILIKECNLNEKNNIEI